MKAFIERVCIIFQILCYSGAGIMMYKLIEHSYAITEDIKLTGWKLLIVLIASIIIPAGIRWMITGKFQMLPITTDD